MITLREATDRMTGTRHLEEKVGVASAGAGYGPGEKSCAQAQPGWRPGSCVLCVAHVCVRLLHDDV